MRRNDKQFKLMKKNLSILDKTEIQIGIFNKQASRSKSEKGSIADSLAERLRINDLGMGVPQREVLRPSMIHSATQDKFIKNALQTAYLKKNIKLTIKKIGERGAANLKKAIVDLKVPAKSQSTIRSAQKRYGGIRDNPLVQTSDMLKAVSSRIK